MDDRPPELEQHPGETTPPDVRRRLQRAPGERFLAADAAAAPAPHGSVARAVLWATAAGIVGAAAIVVVAAPLALDTPLVVVGLLVGLAVGEGARRGDDSRIERPRRRAVAVAVALAAVAGAEVVVWQLALSEGGVLGFAPYLLDTFGPIVPLTAIAALAAAAWRAG
jgi:hypothetical protein